MLTHVDHCPVATGATRAGACAHVSLYMYKLGAMTCIVLDTSMMHLQQANAAQLRDTLTKQRAQNRKLSGSAGFPSVGKSTLLTKLTGTESEVAAYEFTTLTAVPGITRFNGARLQMLDLPGIIEGAADGKGRGRQVISTARTSNLILIILDVLKPITHKLLIEKELESFGIRLNKSPPKMTYKKKEKGGISFISHVAKPRLTREEVAAVCSEYKTPNADIEVCIPLRCISQCRRLPLCMHGNVIPEIPAQAWPCTHASCSGKM